MLAVLSHNSTVGFWYNLGRMIHSAAEIEDPPFSCQMPAMESVKWRYR